MSKEQEEQLVRAVPSAGYSITAKLKITNQPGSFAGLLGSIAEMGASVAEVSLIYSDYNYNIREITINCRSEEHSGKVLDRLKSRDAIELLEWSDDTLTLHEGGKLSVSTRVGLHTNDDLARAYTPGVARVCLAIKDNPELVKKYTIKSNLVAVVTDGSAVLGLGDIGPQAALPVMEGKAALFKRFANIDAIPICLATQDTEEIIATIKRISPGFGGINLEDISAPRCFEIENRLRQELDIPVFHDDQHGTAIVVLAGLINAAKLIGKSLAEMKVVISGFGAGGVACVRMIKNAGVDQIIPCDLAGVVYRGRKERMNAVKEELIQITNPDNIKGTLADALKGADVFIGVSQPGVLTRSMVQSMAKDPIIFALANPIPEILPAEIQDIAAVIATGRSDYANQINNVLCFPGIFRGALDCGASDISDQMKLAAAHAIAESVKPEELHFQHIIPGVFSGNVANRVAERVQAAYNSVS